MTIEAVEESNTSTRHHSLTRAPLGFGESHILLGGGAYRPPCDLQNYWTVFQNSNAIR